MVGADLLYHIHRRLQDICGNSHPDSRFGGARILAVGDLFQLQLSVSNEINLEIHSQIFYLLGPQGVTRTSRKDIDKSDL